MLTAEDISQKHAAYSPDNEQQRFSFTAVVDCNSFYCSAERVFRPDLHRRPIVVLSNNDGCIVSRSDESKALGVGMAEPYFQAKEIIEKNGIEVFSSNYNLYGDMSWRVMETLRIIMGENKVEVYSVDEAFINMDAVPFEKLHEAALQLKETVEQWTGVEVSVGVINYKGKVTVLPITEIVSENDFFDYEAKYLGKSKEITPARISEELKVKIEIVAKKAYEVLKMKGFSRSEFIIVNDEPYMLEMNTIPGLTTESILPQQAREAGISLPELFENAIELALKR